MDPQLANKEEKLFDCARKRKHSHDNNLFHCSIKCGWFLHAIPACHEFSKKVKDEEERREGLVLT
jgi:hypothetical protein